MLGLIRSLVGRGGIYRSPAKATKIIDDEILSMIGGLNGMFKESSLIEEIEAERLKIEIEQDEFIKQYKRGLISDEQADSISDKLLVKWEVLNTKIVELNDVRQDIKEYDSIVKQKEREFNDELSKHKSRTIHELEKGYY